MMVLSRHRHTHRKGHRQTDRQTHTHTDAHTYFEGSGDVMVLSTQTHRHRHTQTQTHTYFEGSGDVMVLIGSSVVVYKRASVPDFYQKVVVQPQVLQVMHYI